MLQQAISRQTFHVASHNSKRDLRIAVVVIQYKGEFLDERTKVRNLKNQKKGESKEDLQTADMGVSKQLNDFFIQLLQLSTYLVQL